MTMAPSVAACGSLALAVLAVSVTGAGAAGSSKFLNITNSCSYTVWPAISSGGSSSAAPETTGFELAPGQWKIVAVPSGWSARVWGRTLCSTDRSSGNKFTCVTGDCGSGRQECEGGKAAPPVTLAQLKLDGSGGMDSYDVSLVDGFNLPLLVAPRGARGREFGNPDKCKPTSYSELFKSACPRAYSYAYDGAGSTFTCAGGGGGDDTTYAIRFCPKTTTSTSSVKPKPPTSSPKSEQPETALINGTTTTQNTGGASQVAGEPWRIVLIAGILSVVAAALGVLAKCLGLFRLCCGAGQARLANTG